MFEILNQYQFLFKEVRNFIQSENLSKFPAK